MMSLPVAFEVEEAFEDENLCNWARQGLVETTKEGDGGQSFFPFAACPASRKVFGYFPSPQTLKEPKFLYQSPSGASGSDSRHSFNW